MPPVLDWDITTILGWTQHGIRILRNRLTEANGGHRSPHQSPLLGIGDRHMISNPNIRSDN